jgi:hypothetical protein
MLASSSTTASSAQSICSSVWRQLTKNRKRAALGSTTGAASGGTQIPRSNSACDSRKQGTLAPMITGTIGDPWLLPVSRPRRLAPATR